MIDERRVMSGTWGELWLEGEELTVLLETVT